MTDNEAGRLRPVAADLVRRVNLLAGIPPSPSRMPDDSQTRLDTDLIAACKAAAAIAERKRTLFYGPCPIDDDAARDAACFSYIEGWYNPAQLHSGLGYRSPMTYEAEREAALIEP